MSEKRLRQIKVNVTDDDYMALAELADRDDRTLQEYLYLLLREQLYGRAQKLTAPPEELE